MSNVKDTNASDGFKAIKTRPEDQKKPHITFDEYRTNMMNSYKGKLHIPPEIVPSDKKWLYADINPASTRDYQMELMEKGWTPVKRSMHPHFNIITERNRDRTEDVVIRHGNILMEIDKYIWAYHERANYELALKGAATAGRKPDYRPSEGAFERAEAGSKYSHERRPFKPDDFRKENY